MDFERRRAAPAIESSQFKRRQSVLVALWHDFCYTINELGRIPRPAFRLDGMSGVASSRFQRLCVA